MSSLEEDQAQQEKGPPNRPAGFTFIKSASEGLVVGEHRPGILGHVLAAEHTDGFRVVVFEFVGIAIEFGDVDATSLMMLNENVLAADFGKTLADIPNEVPQVGGIILFP